MHGALDDFVRSPGVHCIEQDMDHLIAAGAENRGAAFSSEKSASLTGILRVLFGVLGRHTFPRERQSLQSLHGFSRM